MKRLCVAAAVLAIVTGGSAARADDDAQRAESLIEEGQALIAKGATAAACARFRSSDALRPSGTAILNLADCYERNGQYASAHDRFVEAADRALAAGRREIENVARQRARDLAARVSTLTIRFTATPPAGALVKRDDAEVPQSSWGAPLPIDPGAHHVTVSAPEYETISLDVEVGREHSAPEVLVPALTRSIRAAPLAPPSPSKTQKTVGFVIGAAGVGALATGGVLGALAISRHDDVTATCPSNTCPSADARSSVADANTGARSFALGSTVAMIAGVALATAGIVLVLSAPKGPSLTAGLGTATLSGTF